MTQFDAGTQRVFALAVARALRESRQQQQLTQEEVAARTNGMVSKAALAHFESARRHLPVEVLWALAAALGMDIAALVALAQGRIDKADHEPNPATVAQADTVI